MIIGIGSDFTKIERIEESIKNFGDRFLIRIFTERELDAMEKRKRVSLRRYASSAAKRFAAKEACSKALGTGLRQGVFWRDIEIIHQPSGKPDMFLYNGARKKFVELCGEDGRIHVTMTDDFPYAQAFVIIEK